MSPIFNILLLSELLSKDLFGMVFHILLTKSIKAKSKTQEIQFKTLLQQNKCHKNNSNLQKYEN